MRAAWLGVSLMSFLTVGLAAGCSAVNTTEVVPPPEEGPTGCLPGQTDCAGTCVDLSTSVVHCGACGRGCQAGESCVVGACMGGGTSACGDGIIVAGEACDDGNSASGDGCSSTCAVEPGFSCSGEPSVCMDGCGDGVVTGSEECDDGGESATCDADCTLVECGDSVTNTTAGESCDDGAESATCDADCSPVECGDDVINTTAGETCEEMMMESATCDVDCTAPECGDALVNASAGESCDDGGESATCDADCTEAQCGDGVVNATATEACDDGGESASCDDDCTAVMCGDGNLNAAAGEECDDGNTVGNDGCDDACQREFPQVCTTGTFGVNTGSPWTVCQADAGGAWVSHSGTTGGEYDALAICQFLGYSSLGFVGGTFGTECSATDIPSSCLNPGAPPTTNLGQFCSPYYCNTVQWTCVP